MTPEFTDTSYASPEEKARRVLAHIANPDGRYYYDDGYPKPDIRNDATAALAAYESIIEALREQVAAYQCPIAGHRPTCSAGSCYECLADRALAAEADNAALRHKRIALRRSLRQLNKAHAVLWKVVNLQVENIIAMRDDAALLAGKKP